MLTGHNLLECFSIFFLTRRSRDLFRYRRTGSKPARSFLIWHAVV
ncbi:hypothetical protein ACHAXS_011169 [Conticribra weissflogii]